MALPARLQAHGAQRGVSSYRAACELAAYLAPYFAFAASRTATLTRFGAGRWHVEVEPQASSPVLIRRELTYGPGSKRVALVGRVALGAWLRGRGVELPVFLSALRELRVLLGAPAGRRVALSAKTRVLGVRIQAVELDLRRIQFLEKKGDVPRLGAAWGDGFRQ